MFNKIRFQTFAIALNCHMRQFKNKFIKLYMTKNYPGNITIKKENKNVTFKKVRQSTN